MHFRKKQTPIAISDFSRSSSQSKNKKTLEFITLLKAPTDWMGYANTGTSLTTFQVF